MKKNILLSLILLVLIFSSCNSKLEKVNNTDTINDPYWTLEKARKLASDFNSPEKWNNTTLNMEVENLAKYGPSDFPLHDSPFPTPDYKSPGNGSGEIEIDIAGKKIIGQLSIIGRGDHSRYLFKNPNDEYVTYFTILTIADGEETANTVIASSRNHPNYISQGSLNNSTKSRIDWVAIQIADKNAYAIVNGRLFDLRVGRLVLAAPQKDGSIRFYQTDAQPMNLTERERYIDEIKTSQIAIDFFKNKNNI